MEAKIMDVLRRMQPVLDEMQLRELKEVLQMTFLEDMTEELPEDVAKIIETEDRRLPRQRRRRE